MADFRIKEVKAREILDSRGNPTVGVAVTLRSGVIGVASVPSGASTGSHEALELRDGEKKRYGGKGVLRAVANVNKVLRRLAIGRDARDLRQLDAVMIKKDGTPNKSRLGANAILGVSLAAAHAAAAAARVPLYRWLRRVYVLRSTSYVLPLPMMNVLNGGVHAGWAIDLQECLIIPRQKTFRERVRAGAEIFHVLGGLLKKAGHQTLVGDEGGYAPRLTRNEEALQFAVKAIRAAGYVPGREVALGLDAAATEFYDAKNKIYRLRRDGQSRKARDLVRLFESWAKKYPLMTLEDPLAEDDWENWRLITKRLGRRLKLVGDDLFVTKAERLKKGIALGAANAILIKVNQIGTLSETIDAIRMAQKSGYAVAVSHRSGETCDTTIADLAVAVNADYIKTGSLSRSERVAKYNRLMEIEEELLG
ncbi:phosphopyruvate hydratase [Patescibacteria group bacterium]|nr:MAG: phosphopyruvate hydratase [Patescibacteria group bacterium]